MKKFWVILSSSIVLCFSATQAIAKVGEKIQASQLSDHRTPNLLMLAEGNKAREDVQIIQITENISIAAQISESQIAQLPDSSFKAVLNIRSLTEEGAIPDQQLKVESLGIPYMNLPVTAETLDVALIDRVLEQIDGLPKQLLVHCGSSFRAGFMVMMYQITREGVPIEEAKSQYLELGFNYENSPPFKAAMDKYFAAYSIE